MYTQELFNIINNHFLFMEHKFALNKIISNDDIAKIFESHLNFFNQSIEYNKDLKIFNQYDDFTVSLDNKNDKMDTSKKFIIKTSENDSITIHSSSDLDLSSKNNLNRYNNSLRIGFIVRKNNEVVDVLQLVFKHINQEDKTINTIDLSLGTNADNIAFLEITKNHNHDIQSINIRDCVILNDSNLTISSFDKDIIKQKVIEHIFNDANDPLLKEAIIYGGLSQNTTDLLALTKDMSGLYDYVVDKQRTVFDMIKNEDTTLSSKNRVKNVR